MDRLLGVAEAAHELGVNQARVRALISAGDIQAQKLGGRWLVDASSVSQRQRAPSSSGRRLAPRNAWLALLIASGQPLPHDVDSVARWRMRQALDQGGLQGLRPRLAHRAHPVAFWALDGELQALLANPEIRRSGSNAAGHYKLGLLAPNAVDAYVKASQLPKLIKEHALQPSSAAQSNVVVRAVDDEAWLLDDQPVAPLAAVALDLASYPDSRSSRVGQELITDLDRGCKS